MRRLTTRWLARRTFAALWAWYAHAPASFRWCARRSPGLRAARRWAGRHYLAALDAETP